MPENDKQDLGQSSGWKSFEEVSEKYSPAEMKIEKGKRFIGLWLGPLVFVIVAFLIPSPAGMTDAARQVLAILGWTVIWWICEPIPIPASSFLPFILIPVMGILPPAVAFGFLGHPNTFLMIGVYIFIGVLIQQGFTKRLAYFMLSRKLVAKSPTWLLFFFVFGSFILSAFMSNIPVTMLFLTVGAGVCEALQIAENHPYSRSLKFGATYGSQAGGLATPVGNPNVNFLAMGLIISLVGFNFRFVDWVVACAPFAVIMLIISVFLLRGLFRVKLTNMETARQFADDELKKLGSLRRGEKIAIFLALLAIVLWLIPSITAIIFGDGAPITATMDKLLNVSVVSIFVAVLAFLLPVNWKERKFATTWTKAERSVNWGAIFIVACGFLLGGAMNHEDVRLIGWMANSLSGAFEKAPSVLIILGFVVLAIIVTQFISNVPAASIIITVSVPVAMASGLNPVALAITIAMAAQMSYVLPIAAPQMALTYGSGGIKMGEFIKVGVIISVISIPILTFFLYNWVNMIFPM